MKFFSIIMLVVAALGVSIRPASAWVCVSPSTVQKGLDRSDVVFVGVVKSIADGQIVFNVSGRWKGVVGETAIVTTPAKANPRVVDPPAAYRFRLGEEYLVYAYNESGLLVTSVCTRTNLVKKAGDDLKILGQPKIP